MAMISALAWADPSACNEFPSRYSNEGVLGEEEEMDSENMEDEEMDTKEENSDSMLQNTIKEVTTDDITKKYNLDAYDEEENDLCFVPPTYYQKGTKDPNLTQDGEEDEDMDDLRIKESDAILVAATTEEDQFSHVNIYVYEREASNLYIHHDIVLASFPLCMEWMEFHPSQSDSNTGSNNTLAVGTFNPEIEIWDLDLMDALTPLSTLGGINQDEEEQNDISEYARLSPAEQKKLKQKMLDRAAKRTLRDGSHRDAVMSLSWNTAVRNVLASGSADQTVKIWDMEKEKCLSTFSHHNEKVQAIAWNPTEPNLLLSAGYDKSAVIIDIRDPSTVHRWKLTADVEKVEWNAHKCQEFLVSSEDGVVKKFDSLAPQNTLFTLHAHSGSVGGLSINKAIPDCLATCSDDKSFKIWDIKDNKPSCVFQSDSANAQLFTVAWDVKTPNLLSVGGRGHLQVVDVSKIEVVVNQFSKHIQPFNAIQQ